MPPPNVLYFVVHDLGRHLGCYGVPSPTPRIDAFAGEAVRFTQAYCNSVACSPSRGCAMTGQHAHVSGGVGLAHMGWPLPDAARTVVDRMNDIGYETIHAGMQHERADHANRYATDLQADGSAHTAAAVDEALAYLEGRDRGRPFYLNLGSLEPHPCTWNTHVAERGADPADAVFVPPSMPDTPGVRESFGKFYASIRYMDEHFRRLMDGLERLGHDRDTVVIFTADHGIMNVRLRSKGTLYDRGCAIAMMVRTPQRARAGQADHTLLQNIDVVPTVLDIAGAEPDPALPGASFWPRVLGTGNYTPHEAIFTERNFHGERRYPTEPPASALHYIDRFDPIRAIRTPDWHYIRYFDPTIRARPWLPWEVEGQALVDLPAEMRDLPLEREPRVKEELFHVAEDGLELRDLATRPELAKTKAALADRLDRWMRDTDDFLLRDDPPRRQFNPTVLT